ncbi:MAG: anthranilate synthase component I [Fimbriimonadaceae bacterium]|nr:anthranilate synthase component I [Fimbriimonadaceae bacterium]
MPKPMQYPTKPEYLSRTEGKRPMPVVREILADMETPLSAYWKLASEETFSFLLESVTGGEQLARYSILGVRPRAVLRTKGRRFVRHTREGDLIGEVPEGQDPLHLLQTELDRPRPIPVEGLPTFVGGAIGMLGYDIVRFFERLPDTTTDDLGFDDLAMMLTDTVVVFDHAKNVIKIIVLADGSEAAYDAASTEIETILAALRKPLPPLPREAHEIRPVVANITKEAFEATVARTKEYIAQGDGIQMVLSQRFETRVDAHPVTVYRALRSLNPSPYMFLLRYGDFDLVGASPEILVSLHQGTARVRPIAGTRWRGKTPEEDEALATELLADEKERAEHIMLVDLGRNDLGRVCDYGSVTVNDLMVIERYSHVMHIVSDVTGRLRIDMDAYDLVRATFPAGTVSGAPKVRAMEIIDELETTRRGTYAGSVGFFSASGDMDLCITLRTIAIKDGTAYVQAGGGIVHDSRPELEYNESRNKAAASLRALEIAQSGLEGAL